MRRVTYEEYLDYAEKIGFVEVAGKKIGLKPVRVERLTPRPGEIYDTLTTLWDFPRHGSWATHSPAYRGSWPPQLARTLLLNYTEPGDTVVDPFAGGGTTCIEAKLLGRHCIAVDVNYQAVIITLHKLYWLERALEGEVGRRFAEDHPEAYEAARRARVEVYVGDARRLTAVADGSAALVATHPPYWTTIQYGRGVEGDLSNAETLEEYLEGLSAFADEARRILRPGGHLAVLLGDTRKHGHYVPLTFYGLHVLLSKGFILREEVVKVQHNPAATLARWLGRNKSFLLIMHEKLYVFHKPKNRRDVERHEYSTLTPLRRLYAAGKLEGRGALLPTGNL